jgi:hypothetical protein
LPGRAPFWVPLVRPAAAILVLVVIALAVIPGSLARIHQLVELGVGFLR